MNFNPKDAKFEFKTVEFYYNLENIFNFLHLSDYKIYSNLLQ